MGNFCWTKTNYLFEMNLLTVALASATLVQAGFPVPCKTQYADLTSLNAKYSGGLNYTYGKSDYSIKICGDNPISCNVPDPAPGGGYSYIFGPRGYDDDDENSTNAENSFSNAAGCQIVNSIPQAYELSNLDFPVTIEGLPNGNLGVRYVYKGVGDGCPNNQERVLIVTFHCADVKVPTLQVVVESPTCVYNAVIDTYDVC